MIRVPCGVPRAHSWTCRARDGDAIGLDRRSRARAVVAHLFVRVFGRRARLVTGSRDGGRRRARRARSIASSLRGGGGPSIRFDPRARGTRTIEEGTDDRGKRREKRRRRAVRRCGRGWTRAGWGRDGREGRSRRRGAAAAARRTIQTARGRRRRRWDGWCP